MEWEIVGIQYLKLTKPCIYSWWRDRKCLYVGKSENGIARVLGKHHIINTVEFVQADDRFEIEFPVIAPDTSLDLFELYYIDKYKPCLNTVTPDYEKLSTKDMSTMREAVRDKKKLAEVLYTSVPDHLLLEDSSDSTNSIAALTDEQLKKRLNQINKAIKISEKLVKFDKKNDNYYINPWCANK